MDKHTWISKRAEKLWQLAGEPTNKDLDFWLEAEKEYNICVLSPGSCPFQRIQPTTGGRHIAICEDNNKTCNYHLNHEQS